MLQPYIEVLPHSLMFMMKKLQEFPVLSVSRNGLPSLSWTQKCECRLKICFSVLVSVLYGIPT